MNKKGFTLVELITTFALAAVVLVLLINVVVMIKNIYTKSNIQTELLINQANLSNVLNSKLKNENLVSYTNNSESVDILNYTFELKDGKTYELKVSDTEIKFGNFTYDFSDGTEVSTPTLTDDGEFLVIKIPIKNKLFPKEDFGINLVYVY